jgi:hypothetical protein
LNKAILDPSEQVEVTPSPLENLNLFFIYPVSEVVRSADVPDFHALLHEQGQRAD